MSEPEPDDQPQAWWADYLQGLRTGVRNNGAAYGYSILATVGFATLNSRLGSPETGHLFLFVIGAALAFTLVEGGASRGFRDRMRGDRSDVIVVGSAVNFLSITSGLAIFIGVAALWQSWITWLTAPFAATVVYLLTIGVEMAFARRTERARES